MAELFGYPITKATKLPDLEEDKKLQAFTPRQDDDGSLTVVAGNMFGQIVDVEGMIKSDSELISRYRSMSDHPAINSAVTSIVNEAIINEPEDETVKIDLSKTKFAKSVRIKVEEEFDNILNLLNFEQNGYEIFRRWYIDGRLYYHAMVDFKKPADGIQEMRYVDPRKIRRIKEVQMDPSKGGSNTDTTLVKPSQDYYLFNENGFGRDAATNIAGGTPSYAKNSFKISKDAIVHVTSGLMEETGKSVVSYLHKAVVPLNQLNMLEQAVVIYRLSRAPERRVFTVDVTGMQPAKAEQYMAQLITNAKNKVSYDPTTGQVSDQRKFQTMFEDFWLPNRDGKGTKVDTLPGGQNLGQMEDVEYFQKKLYQSLEVPVSRLMSDDVYTLGRATEISREEIAFEKFITRLRSRFSLLLLKTLRLQLLLKRVITVEDWDNNVNLIGFQYAKDNLFAELKDNEVMMGRLNVMMTIAPYVGRYYSDTWVRRNIAKQTDEDIKDMDKEIKDDKNNPQYLEALGDDMQPGMGALPPGGDDGQDQQGGPPQKSLAAPQQQDR
jgi:hypothetical protein